MKREYHGFLETQASQVPETVEWRKEGRHLARSYRAPQLFVIGKAVDLVQQSSGGQLRDGNGGWWVWGS